MVTPQCTTKSPSSQYYPLLCIFSIFEHVWCRCAPKGMLSVSALVLGDSIYYTYVYYANCLYCVYSVDSCDHKLCNNHVCVCIILYLERLWLGWVVSFGSSTLITAAYLHLLWCLRWHFLYYTFTIVVCRSLMCCK